MIRGLYTGASGMVAQQHRLDQISNNLANVDTNGYKRDMSLHKAFPELLIRRFNDDGVMRLPPRGQHLGSVDTAPIVGTLGTGVEQNEAFTVFSQGSLQETQNPFDIALEGDGFVAVDTPNGERYTRNGSFHLGPESMLVTKQGYPVLGEDGRPLQIKENNFYIDKEGTVFASDSFPDDPRRLISMDENQWEDVEEVGSLKLVDVREPRYLRKQGESLWNTTKDSGEAQILSGTERPAVQQGFLEKANVNPVTEMVRMIEVNRAYEANQKAVQTQDESTGRLLNQALRL
ncbi:MAG: flagellar basal-body rod protein FlgF [Spirochaetota bacterium]